MPPTILDSLPGARPLGLLQSPPDDWWLGEWNGATALDGALRLFALGDVEELWTVSDWNAQDTWRGEFGRLQPRGVCIGEDAFGTQFVRVPDLDEVALFWPETGTMERIGLSRAEFVRAVIDDPDGTVSLHQYRKAVSALGRPSLREHLAMKVETAVGGEFSSDNMIRMPSISHMRALGLLALQIADVPVGTGFTPHRA